MVRESALAWRRTSTWAFLAGPAIGAKGCPHLGPSLSPLRLRDRQARAARHLREAHAVDSWYSQGITVAYERARGLRAINQRTSGAYEFSVSKVLALDAARVVAAFGDARRRRRWTAGLEPDLVSALGAALDHTNGAGLVVKANGRARCRYRWDGTIVEIYVEPRSTSKTSVVIAHAELPSRASLDERRVQWKRALEALAALGSAPER